MTTAATPSKARKRRALLDGLKRASLDRRLLSYAAAPALALAAPAVADADFAGPYTLDNWTFANDNADGTVNPNTSDAASITIKGGNNQSAAAGTTDFTIAVVASGTWSFSWLYTSVDTNGFDSGGYLLNNVYTPLALNSDSPASGSGPLVADAHVNAGDIIGFRVFTVDNFSAPIIGTSVNPSFLTISDFSAPVQAGGDENEGEVPAPSTLALLALGAAGLDLARRRKHRSRPQ